MRSGTSVPRCSAEETTTTEKPNQQPNKQKNPGGVCAVQKEAHEPQLEEAVGREVGEPGQALPFARPGCLTSSQEFGFHKEHDETVPL